MKQSNRIQRSEVWEQIYNLVKQIPQADTNGCDAPDAPSVATDLEELFLKLLPIQHVSQRSELLSDFEKWLDKKGNESYCHLPAGYVVDKYKSLNCG